MYSDADIFAAIQSGDLVIDPYNEEYVSGATVDLTLHTDFLVFRTGSTTHIDVKQPFDVTEKVQANSEDNSIVIHPGEFLLGSTAEKVGLSRKLAGVLEGRSSLGRLGLIIHATASMIKPGFSGYLTLEISNISHLPVKLYAGMRIAQLALHELKTPARVGYSGSDKYQEQDTPTASRIWHDFEK